MLAVELTSVFLIATIFVNDVFSNGEYVPKSVYLLDKFGQKTDEYRVRNRRDLESVIKRFKRSPGNGQSGGGGSAHSYSGSYSHAGPGSNEFFGPDFHNFAANIPTSFEDIKKQAEGFGNVHSRSGASEENLGYNGPILFSRSGVDKGESVKVSGSAVGPNAAFSSSSSSIDSRGNIKYDVKSGKY